MYIWVELLVYSVRISSTLFDDVKSFPRVVYRFISSCPHLLCIRVADIWCYQSFNFCQSGYKVVPYFPSTEAEHVFIYLLAMHVLSCLTYMSLFMTFTYVSIILVFSWEIFFYHTYLTITFFWQSCSVFSMCQFSIVVFLRHKLSGLKQHKFIIYSFYELRVQAQICYIFCSGFLKVPGMLGFSFGTQDSHLVLRIFWLVAEFTFLQIPFFFFF